MRWDIHRGGNEVVTKTIVLSGGGTGGHITPILAVARELKAADPSVRTIYIGERGGKFKDLTDNNPAIDQSYQIMAGKFRRYHGESWVKRLLDVQTNILNIRDLFYFMVGTLQAQLLMRRLRPDTVFLKGGFVGVPVGLAAALQRIPFVTHDSDALPGLANRLVGRWARTNAVAADTKLYPYPKAKTVQVGVLVESDFTHVDASQKRSFQKQLGIPEGHTVLLVTGGSSGARNINVAMKHIAADLLTENPALYIIHQAGRGKAGIYGDYVHERLRVIEFMKPMYVYTGAADIVISRASGNTVAELGTQGKAVIAIANPLLTGGHQLKNADALEAAGAALTVPERNEVTDTGALKTAIERLVNDPALRADIAGRLQAQTLSGAATTLAHLLLQ